MVESTVALEQIGDLFRRFPNPMTENDPDEKISEFNSAAAAIIRRLTSADSSYLKTSNAIVSQYGVANYYAATQHMGILKAIRSDYANGFMKSMTELIHADVFSDFLDMADYLLSEGYKDAAAVIAGSTLEGHLRKLCASFGVAPIKADGKPKKADTINSELVVAKAYGLADQKQVTAWLDFRNKAAHGEYTSYVADQIKIMSMGIREFIARVPA
jgi:hypothetical protein